METLNQVSSDEYLARELISPMEHRFLGGMVYAMVGANNRHNKISVNVLGALHVRLRGRRDRPPVYLGLPAGRTPSEATQAIASADETSAPLDITERAGDDAWIV